MSTDTSSHDEQIAALQTQIDDLTATLEAVLTRLARVEQAAGLAPSAR